MKKLIFTSIILFNLCFSIIANDGSFYSEGNQLIPINETEISVQKEILKIIRLTERTVAVDVYYEFYNPGDTKEIVVGFEALPPYNTEEDYNTNNGQPFIKDFTVKINNKSIPYKIATVQDSIILKNGKIQSMSAEAIKQRKEEYDYLDLKYVYYFDAVFQKGVNVVKHTYEYTLSASVAYFYELQYVLTAANRWANKQIDDFTLIIDMGEFETFNISRSFFKNDDDWTIDGKGKFGKKRFGVSWINKGDYTEFHMHHGTVIFRKKNFKPEGELFLYTVNPYWVNSEISEKFDHNISNLPFSYYQQDAIQPPLREIDQKILRNLPYARRGYVFKDEKVQYFYENMTDWYIADPDYKDDPEALHEKEKEWLVKCKEWEFPRRRPIMK